MGITIAQYQSSIGMFNHVKIKLVIINIPLCYIGTLTLQFLVSLYIISKLICSGDVEVNPGPDKIRLLRLCHINIRSLCKEKIRALKVFSGQYDVITLSETHLDPLGVYDHLKLDGYHDILRRDRKKGGGGVAIFIRECIPFKRRQDFEANNVEALWVQLNTLEGKVLIACCYRPPTQNDFWDNFGNVLENVKEDTTKYLFILGDINANFNTYQGDKLRRFCIMHTLNVHNFDYTRITPTSSTVLDQLLSNAPTFVRSVHVDPPVSHMITVLYQQF